MSTVALPTTAPELSVTVPRMVPVAWAVQQARRNDNEQTYRKLVDFHGRTSSCAEWTLSGLHGPVREITLFSVKRKSSSVDFPLPRDNRALLNDSNRCMVRPAITRFELGAL